MSRTVFSLLALLAVACSPQSDLEEDVDGGAEAPPAGGEPVLEDLPDRVTPEDLNSWNVELDDPGQDADGIQLLVQDGELRVTTGPPGIAWRPSDLVVAGSFTASASFHDLGGAPADSEGYGLVVGGRNLDSPDRRYTYFLVRPSGEHKVERRNGAETEVLVGWTGGADAVATPARVGAGEGRGQAVRSTTLAIEVNGDEVRLLQGGNVVETLPLEEVSPYGFAGVRVDDGIDVRVSDWKLEGEVVGNRLPGKTPDDPPGEG